MDKRIIYPNEKGGISIVIPAHTEATIEEIANRVVPEGVPYKIVNVSEIPTDRTFRDAWEWSE